MWTASWAGWGRCCKSTWRQLSSASGCRYESACGVCAPSEAMYQPAASTLVNFTVEPAFAHTHGDTRPSCVDGVRRWCRGTASLSACQPLLRPS